MKLKTLIRLLKVIELKHGSNLPVVFDLTTIDNGNGCWSVNDVTGASVQHVLVADGDGGVITNKDGTERGKHSVLLTGMNN